jgi:hypothetical protein
MGRMVVKSSYNRLTSVENFFLIVTFLLFILFFPEFYNLNKKVGIIIKKTSFLRGFSNYNNEEAYMKNKGKISCIDDLLSLYYPNEENKEILKVFLDRGINPIYPQICLKGEILLILNREEEEILSFFQIELGRSIMNHIPEVLTYEEEEYVYMRGLFGLSSINMNENPFSGDLFIRVITKISSLGNKFISKRKLPENFAQIIYNQCIVNGNPKILLSVFEYYLGMSSQIFRPSHMIESKNLLFSAREEYFNHDLCDILLYKEEALYLAQHLHFVEEERLEPELFLPSFEEYKQVRLICEKWREIFIRLLKKNAYLLPNDPIQPSIFNLKEKSM